VLASYLRKDKRPDNPPVSALTSSYLRHVFVSAVHSNASREQMAETAAHMSHTLTTAETHYEAHSALEHASYSGNICVLIILNSMMLLVCCVVRRSRMLGMKLNYVNSLPTDAPPVRNISAVHSNANWDKMAETAAHMSHTLMTAETHYEAHGALELTSRACKTRKTSMTHRTVPLLLIFILVVFVLSMQLRADVVEINQQSHVLFVMSKTIKVGEKLLFNYNDN